MRYSYYVCLYIVSVGTLMSLALHYSTTNISAARKTCAKAEKKDRCKHN